MSFLQIPSEPLTKILPGSSLIQRNAFQLRINSYAQMCLVKPAEMVATGKGLEIQVVSRNLYFLVSAHCEIYSNMCGAEGKIWPVILQIYLYNITGVLLKMYADLL